MVKSSIPADTAMVAAPIRKLWLAYDLPKDWPFVRLTWHGSQTLILRGESWSYLAMISMTTKL